MDEKHSNGGNRGGVPAIAALLLFLCLAATAGAETSRWPLTAVVEWKTNTTETSAWFVNPTKEPQTYPRGLGMTSAKHSCTLTLQTATGKRWAAPAEPRRELQNYYDIVVPAGGRVLIGQWDLAALRYSEGDLARGAGQLAFAELPLPARFQVQWWDGVFQLGTPLRSEWITIEPAKSLGDIVRMADVIAFADVREVKMQHVSETLEYQYVTCVLTNVLKGKPVNNPSEVVLQIFLNRNPTPERLLAGKSYLVFLTGDWSLQPVAPTGSIMATADVNDKLLGEVKDLVKACSPIRSVRLNVLTPGGGMADTKIHSGGKVTGGHMSGGPMPFHHMEEASLGGAALSNVIAQAEKICRSPVPSQPEISTNDLVYIHIDTFDHQSKTYQRPRQGQFADAGLVELDKLMHQYRIGAW